MAYNKKVHLRENIDAIKTAFSLDREKRTATAGEREILAKYSGFGGIKAILKPASTPADVLSWNKTDAELFPLVTELHEVLRESSEDEAEYKRYPGSLIFCTVSFCALHTSIAVFPNNGAANCSTL